MNVRGDALTRFVFENAAVRGAYVWMPLTAREVLACHPYPPAVARSTMVSAAAQKTICTTTPPP